LDVQVLLAGQTPISTLPPVAAWTWPASARPACGLGCGKRFEPAMAPPAPVSSSLRCCRARNGAVSRRVIVWQGCVVVVVVIAITFICRTGD
jgi:hypothetical protein